VIREMYAKVPKGYRELVIQLAEGFFDKPASASFDREVWGMKVGIELHKRQATAKQVTEAFVRVDRRSKFWPSVEEFLTALDEVIRETRKPSLFVYAVVVPGDGLGAPMLVKRPCPDGDAAAAQKALRDEFESGCMVIEKIWEASE